MNSALPSLCERAVTVIEYKIFSDVYEFDEFDDTPDQEDDDVINGQRCTGNTSHTP